MKNNMYGKERMSRMKILSFINNKGGVGKTASSAIIAHMLSVMGYKTLYVDVDPQGNGSMIYSDIDMIEVLENLINNRETENGYTVQDLFINPSLDIHECIRNTKYDNLDVIPALLTLSEIETQLKADITSPQQFRLRKHLKNVENEYDYCIIDCSPSVSLLNINALAASNEVFVPVRCDAWSSIGLIVSKKLIDTVADYNPILKIGGYFFTQWNSLKNVSKAVYMILDNYIGECFVPIAIPQSSLIEEMSVENKPLLDIDKNKKQRVTQEYFKLAEYIAANDLDRNKMKKEYQDYFDTLVEKYR